MSETLNKPLPESLENAKENKDRYVEKTLCNGDVPEEEIKLADVTSVE